MKKIVCLLIAMFMIFALVDCSERVQNFEVKNYLYNDEGSPVFVKIYVRPLISSNHDLGDSELCHFQKFFDRISQEDERGSYVIVPIKKKNANDDEEGWVCPYCNTFNEASRNSCRNPDCILFRKGSRDWYIAKTAQ